VDREVVEMHSSRNLPNGNPSYSNSQPTYKSIHESDMQPRRPIHLSRIRNPRRLARC